jgi:hypothetical protein
MLENFSPIFIGLGRAQSDFFSFSRMPAKDQGADPLAAF